MEIAVQFAGRTVRVHFRTESGQIHTIASCPICGNPVYSEDHGLGRAHAMSITIKKMQTHLHLWHDVQETSVDLAEFPESLKGSSLESPSPSRIQ